MRVLLDQAFPTMVAQVSRREFELVRWQGLGLSDLEVLKSASQDGFDAVALLGRASLARPEVISTAIEQLLAVIVTANVSPVEAVLALGVHAATIQQRLKPGDACIVHMSKVDFVPLAALQESLATATSE